MSLKKILIKNIVVTHFKKATGIDTMPASKSEKSSKSQSNLFDEHEDEFENVQDLNEYDTEEKQDQHDVSVEEETQDVDTADDILDDVCTELKRLLVIKNIADVKFGLKNCINYITTFR